MLIISLRQLLTICKNEEGASALEFALLLPVLLLIIGGIIQFGFIFFQYLTITHAAREGARWASLESTEAFTVSRIIAASSGLNPPLTSADITINPPNPTIGDQGNPVTVTIVYQSPILLPFVLSGPTVSLRSSATQRIE